MNEYEGVKKFQSILKTAFLVVRGTEKLPRLRRTKIGEDKKLTAEVTESYKL